MPILHYEYEDPDEKVAVTPRPKARPVGWRAWWEGSPYANPVGGLIDRFMDGVRNMSIPEGPKPATFPLEVTENALRVHHPDGSVTDYYYQDISNLVINFNPENTAWDRENRTRLTFIHEEKDVRYYLTPDRIAILATIEAFLDNRIPYREYVHQSRTFRLQGNMMYKDIQELKKQYGIVW